MKIIISGIFENLSTRSDGSVKLTIGTQELDPSKAGDLFQMRNKHIKVLLSDSNISNIEAELVDAEKLTAGTKGRTPSQRMRAVLFKVHEYERSPMPFDDWYKMKMEAIIDELKRQIE